MIQPKPFRKRPTHKRICTVDAETDPFKEGRAVKPFAIGFHDTEEGTYRDFWGDDCVAQFFAWFLVEYKETPCIVYWHNGGKFDVFFCLDFMDMGQHPVIINGRIVVLLFGGHEFRDSFAIIPEKLSAYQKDEISYDKFERAVREKNKREILAYLKGDCIYLGELVLAFHDMFGDRLTIGGTALPMLHSFHGYECLTQRDDEHFRKFYFGGRVECFEIGNLVGNWKVCDVNSMYPRVMADKRHPVGRDFVVRTSIDKKTHFARLVAKNDGALPRRGEEGELDFACERGEFFATIHEIEAGLETGRLRIERVLAAYQFKQETSFAEFVNHFYKLRLEAKELCKSADAYIARVAKINNIFFKLLLNSAYGKFAQDPTKYHDYAITRGPLPSDDERGLFDEKANPKGWQIESFYGSAIIWKSAAENNQGFKNVATAASITGAARAVLLRGLVAATRPVYCDTDSIICEELNLETNPTELGAWKLEAVGDRVAIAGKKLYAVFNEGESIKHASKGVKFNGEQIARISAGETLTHKSEVPTFKRDKKNGFGTQIFTDRDVKRTGKVTRKVRA